MGGRYDHLGRQRWHLGRKHDVRGQLPPDDFAELSGIADTVSIIASM